jgi:hypothetical protein
MAFGGCHVPIRFAVHDRDLQNAVVKTKARVVQEVALP